MVVPMSVRFLIFPLLIMALALAFACGADDDDDDSGTEPTAEAPAGDDGDDAGDDGDDAGDDGDDSGDDGGDDGGSFGNGTGTLTIGDETWEITGVVCDFSSNDFPFDLSGFTTSSTGAQAQVSAGIYDPAGEGRTEGDGVSHTISINDVEDSQNPSVSWDSYDPGASSGGEETRLTIDGKSVHGEAAFIDGFADELEVVSGTLEVECP